jgi:ABC-type thiamin/hydroxymethylpyrimidine transport system permease subunit
MEQMLATAHTWRGGDGPYTVAPMLGLLVTLLLVRVVFRRGITWGTVAVATGLGPLFATLGATVGYSLTVSGWLVGSVIAARMIRQPGSFGRNLSD